MQGDILDALMATVGRPSHVVDPFVGSGTVLTEALLRDAEFTGVDINPLAVIISRAKAAIDEGADLEAACDIVITSLRTDCDHGVTVNFAHRDKWFDRSSCIYLSRLRRAIMRVDEPGSRKVLWTVMAETIRSCSNSRTSTYKLHVRPPGDRGAGDRIGPAFEANLLDALRRIREYREILAARKRTEPSRAQVLFGDTRSIVSNADSGKHRIVVTSPPYGDNRSTIPYGQSSYLALQWIDGRDLPEGCSGLLASTHTIDTASLGGSARLAALKAEEMRSLSGAYDRFWRAATEAGKQVAATRAGIFLLDFGQALCNVRSVWGGEAYWVITTGNRTSGGMPVPLDSVCMDFVRSLGGRHVATLRRPLPNKRMPTRNSLGVMITTETTLVAEFR